MTFHGGTVQHDQKVFTIFWNPTATPFPAGYQDTINQFVADLDNSDYYGIASQYADGAGNISRRVVFGGTYTDTTSPYPASSLGWNELMDEVLRVQQATGWIADTHSYFQIYTGSNITSQTLCGVHWFGNVPVGQILYPRGGCMIGGTTPNSTAADAAINVSAHEILETVTDPAGGGWYRTDYSGEIGDICAWTFGARGADGGNVTLNGHRYVVQQEYSNATSSCVLSYDVTASPPEIVQQPLNQNTPPNWLVRLFSAAAGLPSPAVQWQSSSDGGGAFTDIPGATASSFEFDAAESDNGRKLRAVYTNPSGTATTNVVTVTVFWQPWVSSQPSSRSVNAGTSVSFTATASASPPPTVQWQAAASGSTTFTDIAGATATTYAFSTTAADDGRRFRAVFSNPYGTATSNAATLTVTPATGAPAVTSQPAAASAIAGRPVSFSAAASGTPTPTVQWQAAPRGSTTFSDVAGATSMTVTFTAAASDDGKRFRAVFTNSAGAATTNEALLTVTSPTEAPAITTQPADVSAAAGDPVTFTAAASGSPAPSASWEYSLDAGATWNAVAGATSATYAFTASTADAGKRFRAVFTNASGTQASAAATLTIGGDVPLAGDLDGDGTDDLVIWRQSTGTWYWLTSSSGFSTAMGGARQWGNRSLGDVPMLGDIDGDGRADLIVWRASTGTWFWLPSSSGYDYARSGQVQWGNASLGDVPIAGDLDGDGKVDLAIWRGSSATWFWLTSATDYAYTAAAMSQPPGGAVGDVPLLGDIDGDGRADLTLWRPATGRWSWLTSTSGFASSGTIQWGSASQVDARLLRDVDGDGKADLLVWRPSNGTWYWLASGTGYEYASAAARQWGSGERGDTPLAADFDGDGLGDLVVWRPGDGIWYWLKSSRQYDYTQGGQRQWGSRR